MIRGLYLAANALEQETKKLDAISNNLANVNTTAYKKDEIISEEFASKLLLKTGGSSKTIINRKPNVNFKEEDGIYSVDTKKGFFRVNTVAKDSYHTTLKFRVNKDGYLITPYKNENHKVIDDYGYKIIGQNGYIKLNENQINEKLKVDEFGNLFCGNEKIDNLLYNQSLDVIGTMSSGIKFNRTFTNYSQGSFMETNSQLDLALSGDGFFVIQSKDGDIYTRDGSFKFTDEGKIVTSDGYSLKGMNGDIIIDDLDKNSNITINEFGEIIRNGQIFDKIEIVDLDDLHKLRKFKGNYYKLEENEKLKDLGFKGRVIQGFLEESNVNPVYEMVKMMSNYRNYESAQRCLRTYDELLGMSVNQIAKI